MLRSFGVLVGCIGVSLAASSMTDVELGDFSEKLFLADEDNVFGDLNFTLGKKIPPKSSGIDFAPHPLFYQFKSAEILNVSTYRSLLKLHDNYIVDVQRNEVLTDEEEEEEEQFIHSIMQTQPMKKLYNLLVDKGFIFHGVEKFEQQLKSMWFGLYERSRNSMSSSGFEHVFLGEIKHGKVSGFHNWLYFYNLEQKEEVDYLGYERYLKLKSKNQKAGVLKFSFRWIDNALKKVGSMFVGTSPQFEMAIYTLCYLTRPDSLCPLKMGGKNIPVQTFRYKDTPQIGSAYVQM